VLRHTLDPARLGLAPGPVTGCEAMARSTSRSSSAAWVRRGRPMRPGGRVDV